MKLVFSAFTSMNPRFYRSLTSEEPDLVPKRLTQLRVMVNAGIQGGVPWLRNSCKSNCLFVNLRRRTTMISFSVVKL